MKKCVLVVAAHPDDEILGCGGTMAKMAHQGNEIYTLILGRGVAARGHDQENAKKQIDELNGCMKAANQTVGVKEVFGFDFPDNSFDSVPILKIIKEIERIKKITKPNIIYTHHYGDLNIDHHIVYKAVLTACRPLKHESVTEIYSFEVPSSTEWSGPNKEDGFIPNRFVDISKTIDKKIKAFRCYKQELRPYPHPRSIKGVRVLAANRGIESGLKFAESFKTIRVVKSENKTL